MSRGGWGLGDEAMGNQVLGNQGLGTRRLGHWVIEVARNWLSGYNRGNKNRSLLKLFSLIPDYLFPNHRIPNT